MNRLRLSGLPAVGGAAIAMAVGSASAPANTHTAASCSHADVQAAVDAASAGDIVRLPAGSAAWSGGLSISKGIRLQGAGAGGFKGSSRTSPAIGTGARTFVTQAGMDLRAGQTVRAPFIADGTRFLEKTVHRCSFDGGLEAGVPALHHTAITLKWNGEDAARSWTVPDTMGAKDTTGLNNLYIEDTYFAGAQCFDFDDNSRTVVRHCLFNNSNLATHGAETSPMGLRHFELYDNAFLFDDLGDDTLNLCRWIWIRGGSGIIADNAMPDMCVRCSR